jgi:hypothetical protein
MHIIIIYNIFANLVKHNDLFVTTTKWFTRGTAIPVDPTPSVRAEAGSLHRASRALESN